MGGKKHVTLNLIGFKGVRIARPSKCSSKDDNSVKFNLHMYWEVTMYV